jgi:hypothetical protein
LPASPLLQTMPRLVAAPPPSAGPQYTLGHGDAAARALGAAPGFAIIPAGVSAGCGSAGAGAAKPELIAAGETVVMRPPPDGHCVAS